MYTLLDPMRRDYRGIEGDHTNEIVDLDLIDVKNSDIILAFCPKPSVGTSMEIIEAHRHLGKVVVTVVPKDAPISPWLRRHSTVIVETVEQGIEWIIAHFGEALYFPNPVQLHVV
jgi:hypothetical protein